MLSLIHISSAIVSICADVSNESYEFIIVEDKNDENKNDNILLYTKMCIRDRFENEPVSISKIMTSQRYSLVTYAAYDVYCTNHDLSLIHISFPLIS